MSLNEGLLLWINHGWAHPLLDHFFTWVSERGSFSYPMLAILLLDSVRRQGGSGLRLWLALALTLALGDILGNFLKALWAEPRPCFAMYEMLRSVGSLQASPCGDALSGMPSNHALNFFIAAVFVGFATPWRAWKLTLFATAILVSLSRIYLGKHYPDQVLIGASMGIALGAVAAWTACRYEISIRRYSKGPQLSHEPGRQATDAS